MVHMAHEYLRRREVDGVPNWLGNASRSEIWNFVGTRISYRLEIFQTTKHEAEVNGRYCTKVILRQGVYTNFSVPDRWKT